MNKSMGCLVFVLIVVLAGYITYNEMRFRQMNQNAGAPPTRTGSSARPGTSGVKGILDPLSRGRQHAARAEKLLREKHYDQASDELTKALTNLKEAESSGVSMLGGAKGMLERAREDAASTVEKAKEGIANLTGKKKTEKEAPKKP